MQVFASPRGSKNKQKLVPRQLVIRLRFQFQKNALLASNLVPLCSFLGAPRHPQEASKPSPEPLLEASPAMLAQLGANLGQLGPTWANMEPTWSQLGANLGPTWGQLGANLGLTWDNLGQLAANLCQTNYENSFQIHYNPSLRAHFVILAYGAFSTPSQCTASRSAA